MKFTGERLVPGAADSDLEMEHMLRYEFAEQFVSGKRILDAACGTGYGSSMLARKALSVCGIDISQDAVAYAETNYANSKVRFICGSVTELPFEDDSFDVVVSYETLEHINEQSQELFLAEISRVLIPGGTLIMSTPNREVYDKRGDNSFHVCEKSFVEFGKMLSERYANVRVFSQQWETGMSITGCGEYEAVLQSALQPETAEYLIAVCSDDPILSCKPLISFAEQGKYQKMLGWAIENHNHIEACNAHIKDLDAEIENYRAVIDSERAEYRAVSEQVHTLQQSKKTLEEKTTKLEKEIADKIADIAALQKSEDILKTRTKELEQEVSDGLERIAALQKSESRLEARITELETEVSTESESITALRKSEDDLKTKITELETEISNKKGHIELLLESDRELERIKNSRSWRFMGYVWKLRDVLIPKGSKRRLLGKMLVKFVKHPIHFLSKCTPHKISKFFKLLRREGVEGTSRRLDDCLIGNQIPEQKLVIQDVCEEADVKTAADYEPLHVPTWNDPCVSIVIPVYNQFDYTYACVKSILQNSGDMTYEIIIADDCSTDVTTEIGQIITGLKTIHNQENLRFLRNCNNAAKQAKGQYILFLNNDTQVQENWLAPLVELMEKDTTIGMTGSKLVYPDGRLQEAGGIFWKDASAWNYGNRSDPTAPEYNYVKDVDYISGAAICIRKPLWEEIGGFDDRFAPAYCEDSDLAFEVRAHGFRVVYQPLSVVVHFEGISNGTDTSSGQKAYQIVNQKHLHEKWKQVLEKEHFPNGENVFLARDRSRYKKTVLVVDHYVPQYDKDAGSRTVFAYLKLFAENGYSVKFIGDNFYPHQPYTQTLQQLGIEVLYGPYYANHWMDWLKENGKYIQYVLLNRPHISVKYIDAVRNLTSAQIMYYGHDLHFLREHREYELTGDPETLKSSEKWKQNELALMRKADMSYYPSYVEEEAIHAIDPTIHVKAIPAYLFSDVQEEFYSTEGRRDLMFIGGFGHQPNVDAVKWLAAEIMPRLERLLPGVVVHILGSNPPEEVKKVASRTLRIEGFVTDEELENYYRTSRLVIVPLRYGAGIKGKVVEAMRYGMPVVTTSIGAEGIAGAETILAIADDPEEFARAVASLYNNAKSLKQRSVASYQYVRENFSPANARKAIGPEFDM